MTSFSLPVAGREISRRRIGSPASDGLKRNCLGSETRYSTYGKRAFKDNFAKALCCASRCSILLLSMRHTV